MYLAGLRPQQWLATMLLCVVAVFSCTISRTVIAAEPVPALDMRDGQAVRSLAPYTGFIADPSASATADGMFARADANEFEPLPRGNATFGFADGAYWFHVRLHNLDHPGHRWLLVLEYALIDNVDVYFRQADGHVEHQVSGDLLPFSARAVRYRHPNFWVDLPQGQTVDLLLRAQSKSSMQVPLALYAATAFIETTRDAQLGIGIYYGILFALFAYNLILWVSVRDSTHFYYSLHVFGFGLVAFCLNGLAFEYLWPNSPWLANAAIPMSMSLSMIVMQAFARDFLELEKRSLWGNRITLGLITFHSVMLVASAFLDYRVAVKVGTAMVFPGIATIIGCGIVVARRGYRPATLFLIAWALFLLGTSAYAMVSFGLLPKNFVTEYGLQIGSASEMIFLSFALAYRWAGLRDENVRIVREARDQLEQRVHERTLELSSALTQLGDANARLREHSERDGLTGVFNRRHLDSQLESLLHKCMADKQSFSLLLTDLDHFKQVNDVNGHLAGDDCLRAMASILREAAGDTGLVARFGGEEFILLFPGMDELAARRCAENIRARVAAGPVKADGAPVQLTVSIGVATVSPHMQIDAHSLLRRADEALYEAKRGGRNRVVQRTCAA